MPQYRAVPVTLSAGERRTLKKRARGAKTAYRDWLRAQIVLAAARGRASARIAADLHVSVDTVRKWRDRFTARGLDGLKDLPRSGRPRRITALERAAVCALACQLPVTTGVPLSRWTAPELAAELVAQGLVSAISPSSVLRILAEHPIKPWQYQSWLFPRDPDFAARATVILDLYQGYYQGKRLHPGDRIVSVDAKPSIQARARCHATGPPGPGRPTRVEHEYDRAGALALLAALDVRTGKVFASCPQTTGIAPFMALMGQVMSHEPYASAPRVFVIVDNGSDHRGKKAAQRLRDAYPNAIMIHTPVHASWLNQVEIVFSIVQKKVISPNDFTSTAQLAATLLAFIDRYNQTARPFNWKFTAADLTGLLQRLSARDEPANLPEAA
ncbi:MAG TPA: IS630 family transposase [Streptosporangiaceae bacterium]|nr:IS630 family transposase [Streptosporangiaceae bacterium]